MISLGRARDGSGGGGRRIRRLRMNPSRLGIVVQFIRTGLGQLRCSATAIDPQADDVRIHEIGLRTSG